MKNFFKILLILLAVFPLWMTILALGEAIPSPKVMTPIEAWKEKINYKLLDYTDKKIQLIEILTADREIAKYEALLHSQRPFEIDLSQVRAQGISSLQIKFYDAQKRLDQMIRISGKLLVQELVPVATRVLTQGQMIADTDIKMEWRDAGQFRGQALKEADALGRMVRTQIPDGEPIFDAYTAAKTLITRGDRVKVDVVSPGLMLSTFGIAQEAGGKGQAIRVLQVDSHKEISGIVRDDHSVEVRL